MAYYHLYLGNDLLRLINKFAIPNLNNKSVFFDKPTWIIVQNNSMISFFKKSLADLNGIYTSTVKCYFPDQAIRLIVNSINEKHHQSSIKSITPFYYDELHLLVLSILRKIYYQKEYCLERELLLNHLITSNQKRNYKNKDVSVSLYHFSQYITKLFYNYSNNVPLLLDGWNKNTLYYKNHIKNYQESWQQILWNKIRQWCMILNDFLPLFKSLTQSQVKSIPTEKIIIIGSAFLSPVQISFFSLLSRYLSIDHLLFSPIDPRYFNKKKIDKKKDFNYKLSSAYLKQYFALSQFVKKNSIFYDFDYHFNTINKIKNTSLNQNWSLIQKKLLTFKDNELLNQTKDDLNDINNNPIFIFSAPNKTREIEIIKDKIIDLLKEDPALALNDIAVITPSNINDYKLIIEEVFRKPQKSDNFDDHLPYNIIDINRYSNNLYLSAFEKLLSFSHCLFAWTEFKEFLENPCTLTYLKLDEKSIQTLEEIIFSLNIRWGISNKHKKVIGKVTDQQNTWSLGIEKLCDNICLPFTQNDELNPYYGSIDENMPLFEIFTWIEDLYDDFLMIGNKELSIQEWVEWIRLLLKQYLPIENSTYHHLSQEVILSQKKGHTEIEKLLSHLLELDSSHYSNDKFDLQTIILLLQDQLKNLSSSHGQYLIDGINFSSLKPMRSIPFKIIFVIGMNEGVFPQKNDINLNNLADAFYDQYKKKISSSDIAEPSTFSEIEYLSFLEILQSAKQRCFFSYIDREMIQFKKLYMSNTLDEIFNYLKIKPHIEKHKLHGFDQEYFLAERKYNSNNKKHFEQTKQFIKPKKNKEIKTTSQTVDKVSIYQLTQMLLNPIEIYHDLLFNHNQKNEIPIKDKENLSIEYFDRLDLYKSIFESQNNKVEDKKHFSFSNTIKAYKSSGKIIDSLNTEMNIKYLHSEYSKKTIEKEFYKNTFSSKGFFSFKLEQKQRFYQYIYTKNRKIILSPSFCINSYFNTSIKITGQLNLVDNNDNILVFSDIITNKHTRSYLNITLTILILTVLQIDLSKVNDQDDLINESDIINKTKEERTWKIWILTENKDLKCAKNIIIKRKEALSLIEDWISLFHEHIIYPLPIYYEYFSKYYQLPLLKDEPSNTTPSTKEIHQYLFSKDSDSLEIAKELFSLERLQKIPIKKWQFMHSFFLKLSKIFFYRTPT